MDGPRENRLAVLAQPGWDEWFLELLLDNSPCMASARATAADAREALSARSMPASGAASAAASARAALSTSSLPAGAAAGARSDIGLGVGLGSSHHHTRADGDPMGDAGQGAVSPEGNPVHPVAGAPGQGADGGGEGGGGGGSTGARRRPVWEWAGPEAALVRKLLRALYRQALADMSLGWTCLERAACYLRCDGCLRYNMSCARRSSTIDTSLSGGH